MPVSKPVITHYLMAQEDWLMYPDGRGSQAPALEESRKRARLREYARAALTGLLAAGTPPVTSTVRLAWQLAADMLREEPDGDD